MNKCVMKTLIGIEIEGTLVDKNGCIVRASNYFDSKSPDKQEEYHSGTGWGCDGCNATAEFRGTPQPLDQIDKIVKEVSTSLAQIKKKNVDVLIHPKAGGTNGLHITIDRFVGAIEVMKILDILVAMPLALIEHNSRTQRLKQYGKLGSYNQKDITAVRHTPESKELVEWRTLSAFWATTPELLKLVLSTVSEIIMFVQANGEKANDLYIKIIKKYNHYSRSYTGKTDSNYQVLIDEIETMLPEELKLVKQIFKISKANGIKTALSRMSMLLGWDGKTPIQLKEKIVKPKKSPLLFSFIADECLTKANTKIRKTLTKILVDRGYTPLYGLNKKPLVFENAVAVQSWANEYAIENKGKETPKLLVIRGSDSGLLKTSFSPNVYGTNSREIATCVEKIHGFGGRLGIDWGSYNGYLSKKLSVGIVGLSMAVRKEPEKNKELIEVVKVLVEMTPLALDQLLSQQYPKPDNKVYIKQIATKKELAKVKEAICVA